LEHAWNLLLPVKVTSEDEEDLMTNFPMIGSLEERTLAKRLTRRRLLNSVVGVSGVVAFSTLLAACAEEDDDVDDTAVEPEDDTESAPEDASADTDDDEDVELDDSEVDDQDAVDDSDGDDGPDEGQMGGTLRVALDTAPPNLDSQLSTAYITRSITSSVVEGLFTLDDEYDVIPQLAESYEASEDNLQYQFTLREGVLFHNGDELNADDVVASIERWLEITTPGAAYSASIDSVEALSDYEMEIQFNEPFGHMVVAALAFSYQAASIHPLEQIEETGDDTMSDPIGTGPFRVVGADLDREIVLERFEDYVSRDEPSQGYGGRKTAFLDSVVFIPTPEAAVRVSGLEAGDYDFAIALSRDDYPRLEDSPDIQPIVPFQGSTDIGLNNQAGLFADRRIRQAFQAALNMEEILMAAFADEQFYRLDPGLWPQETVWWTDAGGEYYNQNDPDRAAELLEEAGYDGSPIRWLTTEAGTQGHTIAVAATPHLERAGFTVEYDTVDWATLLSRVYEPETFDCWGTGFSIQPEPTQYLIFDCEFASAWCDDQLEDLLQQLKEEPDFDRRYEIWEEIHEYYWQEAPAVKLGDYFNLHAARSNVHGYAAMNQMFWYNVWLEE
jgi:peptide/nickel transport system substrate-binding protein